MTCSLHTSRTTRWAGYVARVEGELNRVFRWGNLREREHLGDIGIEERILLQGIFKKLVGIME